MNPNTNTTESLVPDGRDHFSIEIADESFNFRSFPLDDEEIVSAQIIDLFGDRPDRNLVVFHHLANGELETLRPAEPVKLRRGQPSRFFVIEGDELFRFTVAGLQMEWPRPKLKGAHVKLLARTDDDDILIQVTAQGHIVIENDAVVLLKPRGVEEFILKKRPDLVTVYYKEQPFELKRRRWSTEELIEKFGVPAGYKLDLIGEGCEFIELKPGDKLQLEDGMEFTSHAPRGQSS